MASTAVWTPLYPGFRYDPARFRSMTLEGFMYDPVFRFETEDGFHYDERGFRVEAEEDVAYDIASFCARVNVLQGEAAAALASHRGGDVETEEVGSVSDEDDASEEGFRHIIGLAEELLEGDDETRGFSTS